MIKVAVVDDHALVRNSLSQCLRTLNNIEVAIEAGNGQILLHELEKKNVDVVLLDINMPVMDGYETCERLNEFYPDLKILMITNIANQESIRRALNAGAHGYFSKGGELNELEQALHAMKEKGFYFEASLAGLIHKAILWNKNNIKEDKLAILSQREITIIKMVCNGYSNIEIGDKLSINIRTVESHRNKIIEKTGAKNFSAVMLMALKYNYISVEELLIA